MIDKSDRLRHARIKAGYANAVDAVNAFGWKYPTYNAHENGSRGIKLPDLEKYARAFGVTMEWLLTGKTPLAPQPNINTRNRVGMEEPDAVPFHPASDRDRLDMRKLAMALAPSAKRIELFELRVHYPGLALLKGDLLVVDTSRTETAVGAPVLTQVANQQTDTGRTVLRLQAVTGLLPPFGETGLEADEIEAALGAVVATMRPLA